MDNLKYVIAYLFKVLEVQVVVIRMRKDMVVGKKMIVQPPIYY